MTAPGNFALTFSLLALFVACSGYTAGRIHQRYRTDEDREEAYRHGYDTASRSVFTLAARIIAPRRSAARGSARVKNALGEATTSSLRNSGSKAVPTVAPADAVSTSGEAPRRTVSSDLRALARNAFGWGASSDPDAAAPSEAGSDAAGPGAAGSDATWLAGAGSDAAGLGAVGSGAAGSGAAGFGRAESGVVGSGVAWLGAAGPEAAGSDASGSGGVGTGISPTGSGAPTALSRAAGVRNAAGFGELGFPAPPPPSPRTVAEPAAVGGLTFQPFPDPRPAGGFGPIPAFADDGPDLTRPVTDDAVTDHPVSAKPARKGSKADGRRAAAERSAGHRAADGEAEPTVPPAEKSGGRHTVPDELVRAATYRLPPDRVFRAKVPGTTEPPAAPEDLTARRSVPKPRQS